MAVLVQDENIQIERLKLGSFGTNAYKDEFAVFSSRHHSPALCGDVLWLSS